MDPAASVTAMAVSTTAMLDFPTFLTDVPALTSIWTPAYPGCSNRWVSNHENVFGFSSEGSSEPVLITNPSQFEPGYSSCRPQTRAGATPIFSPGVCPGNWTLATVSEFLIARGQSSIWGGLCCPSGLSAAIPDETSQDFPGSCRGVFSTSMTALVPITTVITSTIVITEAEGAESTALWSSTSFQFSCPLSANTDSDWIDSCSTSLVAQGTLLADPIAVYWARKDLSNFPPEYASSIMSQVGETYINSTSASSTSLVDPADPADPVVPDAPVSASKGKTIYAGVIAGVVIGAITGLGLLVAGIVLLLRRRRQNSSRARGDGAHGSSKYSAWLHGRGHSGVERPLSLDTTGGAWDRLPADSSVPRNKW